MGRYEDTLFDNQDFVPVIISLKSAHYLQHSIEDRCTLSATYVIHCTCTIRTAELMKHNPLVVQKDGPSAAFLIAGHYELLAQTEVGESEVKEDVAGGWLPSPRVVHLRTKAT